MKLIRFTYKNKEYYGIPDKDTVELCSGSIAEGFAQTGEKANMNEIKILAPVMPSKAVCVGRNYRAHVMETGSDIPEEPMIFIKPTTTIIANGESIVYPPISKSVDYEGELAIIIGATAKNVPADKVYDYIFGYTCANDVTARDLQRKDGQWTRGKGFDTFMPLGPCIETDIDPTHLPIRTLHNGKVVQESNTELFIFDIPRMISFITEVMTLLPGDVVLTGTPSGIGPMQPGDSVVVEIDGIGRLENTVK